MPRNRLWGLASAVLLVIGVAAPARAVNILIQGTTVGGGVPAASILDNFYNGQPGFNSSLLASNALVTAGNLAGIDLFVGYVPADPYAASEITALAGLLSSGGRILFMGENGAPLFTPSNTAINNAISSLGGLMASDLTTYDGGFHDATVGNGQVLPHPLTNGVQTFNYAAPSGVGGIVGGNALFLTTNLVTAFAGVETIGAGDIVFVADSNPLNNLGNPSNDNDQFFLNVARVQRVSEPTTLTLIGLGLTALGRLRRRRL